MPVNPEWNLNSHSIGIHVYMYMCMYVHVHVARRAPGQAGTRINPHKFTHWYTYGFCWLQQPCLTGRQQDIVMNSCSWPECTLRWQLFACRYNFGLKHVLRVLNFAICMRKWYRVDKFYVLSQVKRTTVFGEFPRINAVFDWNTAQISRS